MSNALKITILGGCEKGREVTFEFASTLLVGRSRSAEFRLKDSDVSGKHFEFVRSESGCFVRDLSRHGLTVDGKDCGEGEQLPVHVGSEIALGQTVRMRVEALPEAGDAATSTAAETAANPSDEAGADFFDAESTVASTPTKKEPTAPEVTAKKPEQGNAGDAQAHGEFDDALTEAGDGETQEMKTRVGSMEEIYERKRQLDRESTQRRWHFGVGIAAVLAILACVWFWTGSYRHVSDAQGPYLPNGKPDVASWLLRNDNGQKEIFVEYPRDDNMKVTVAADSNGVEVASFLGIDRDVPFHLSFKRAKNPADLAYSLEESFERLIGAEAAEGTAYETPGGRRPNGEFFENVYPGFCEIKTQHGVRFVRAEFTRTRDRELWHGVLVYFRRGDYVYTHRREVPEIYWKRAGYRITGELHLALCYPFLSGHWDSPGRGAIVGDALDDNELLARVRRELAAERVAGWNTVATYIDTLLVRSWGEKPLVQQAAYELYRTFLERMTRLYNERRFAFETARQNRNEKRMRQIFRDCLMVFGSMPNDRRCSLVNNPEVWKCP